MNFAAKNRNGHYWCGDALGWVGCRFCAVKMDRRRAHALAHMHSGRVVRIVKTQSHALIEKIDERSLPVWRS